MGLQATSESVPADQSTRCAQWKFLVLLVGLGAILFLGWKFGLVDYLQQHKEEIRSFIRSLGPWGPFLYGTIYAIGVVLAVPGTILTILAALLFGTIGGTLVVVVGATLGATGAFLIARYLGREFVASRLAGRWKTLDKGFREGGFYYLLFLRLVPLVPFNVLNYGSGLTDIRLRDYVLATAIGIVPGTFVYCYATTSVVNIQESKVHLVLAFTLLGILALFHVAYKKWRKGRNHLTALGLGALVVFWTTLAGTAWAHHPERQEQLSSTILWQDTFQVELRYVDFDVSGVRGNYWMINLRGSARLGERWTVSGNLPVVNLNAGGRSFLGLGDLITGVRYDFLTWDRGTTTLGATLAVGWPTGNHTNGIGAGHFELAPGLAFTKAWEGVTLFGQVGINFSLENNSPDTHEADEPDHSQPPVSLPLLVEPHADRELIGVIGAAIRMTDFARLNLSVGSATVLEAEQRGRTIVNASPALVIRVREGLYADLSGQLPLTSQRRFNWQTSFVFSYLF